MLTDRMMHPDKKEKLFQYTRVCGKCNHREKYDMQDDSKCASCGAGVPFQVTRRS